MKERSPKNNLLLESKQNFDSESALKSMTVEKRQVWQLKTWQLFITTVVLLASGFLLGQKYQSPQSNPVPQASSQTTANILPVSTVEIKPVKTYQTTQIYTGEVTAVRTSEVGFERGGKLISVLVDEGDRLSLGESLAKLDTSNLEAQRQELVAQKAEAQARYLELKNGVRKEQIAAAQATVRDLEQQLKLEQLKSSRREYLYQEGAIAREQLDEIAFNTKALNERLTNAKSNLNELQNGTRKEQIAAQQAVVERLTAKIIDLDITITKSVLRSPFDGIVSLRHLDEGTVVTPGQSILRLVENTQPEVKIGVPISVVNTIQLGSQQQIVINNRNYSATVNSILPEVDTTTRTRTLVLKLNPSATDLVSPGEIARLAVTTTIATDGYWLPVSALVKGDRGLWNCFAIVKEGNNTKVDRRYVEVLATEPEKVLVRGTLQPGDLIVSNGTHRLVPGQLVRQLDK